VAKENIIMDEQNKITNEKERVDLLSMSKFISQLDQKPLTDQSNFFSQPKPMTEQSNAITQPPVQQFQPPVQQSQPLTQPQIEPIKDHVYRVPSGIPGFDELIGGGFIPNTIVLVSGEAGTGKTLFCTQYIWNALCTGENGVYITLQETTDEIKKDVTLFGRDFSRAEQLGQCRIVKVEPQNMKDIVNAIIKNVKAIGAKRLAIDSITMICEFAEKKKDIRYQLSRLFGEIKKLGVTTLAISEIEEGSEAISKFGVEEFMVDGVIVLNCGVNVGLGGTPRSLYVKKMRRTSHDLNIHPFEITERGIKVIS
jgi:KaiC/GvpD/RAD55 family RecA-like ATPase